jgi:hypothetical protein
MNALTALRGTHLFFSTKPRAEAKYLNMSLTLNDVTKEAFQLSAPDQLALARVLLENSEASGDLDVTEAWEEEIERRIRLVDSGRAQGRPFALVLQEIDRRFSR